MSLGAHLHQSYVKVLYFYSLQKLPFLEYLYTLRRTYILTSHTKYAILFSYHKWLLVGCWMSRCFQPLVHINRTGFYTSSVCYANVEIYTNLRAPYAQLTRWVYRTPYLYSLEGTCRLSLCFK